MAGAIVFLAVLVALVGLLVEATPAAVKPSLRPQPRPADSVAAYYRAFDSAMRSADPDRLRSAVVKDAWPKFFATRDWMTAYGSPGWSGSTVSGVREVCSDTIHDVVILTYHVAFGGRQDVRDRNMIVARDGTAWKPLGDAQFRREAPLGLPPEWVAGYTVDCRNGATK